MPSKTPKTQNQWAGFQVRECNDYDAATGICHHEETPIRQAGGLHGHDFPNNICKYFHQGRDGSCPRTFQQNIAAGLINMDAVAEEILRQAAHNIRHNAPYDSAAIREVRMIWRSLGAISPDEEAGIDYIVQNAPAHRISAPSPKKNYSTQLWLRIKEKEQSHQDRCTRTVPQIAPQLPALPIAEKSAFSRFGHCDEHDDFAHHYPMDAFPRPFSRKKTHHGWAGFQVRECDNYDAATGICMHEETSCHHRGGLHGNSFPNNVCKYFHRGRDGAFPRTHEQNLAAGLVNIESITDELYRQAYSSIISKQSYESAAIRQCRSVMNVGQWGDSASAAHEHATSQKVADADLKHNADDPHETDDGSTDNSFEAVHIPPGTKRTARASGFIADAHFLKPASACYAAGHWAQLWLRECDRYQPDSDVCAYEQTMTTSSFPENVCLHFHPGRNSNALREKHLTAKQSASRALVARVLVADSLAGPPRRRGSSNPTPLYITNHAITENTIIRNELPTDFSVKSVDLPYRWYNQLMKRSTASDCLPEICLTLHALAVDETHIAAILDVFGFVAERCERRTRASGEAQYFLWTRTKNGYLLKGIDSLFTVIEGSHAQRGIAIGDHTLCPADSSVNLGARLRFLLLEEVADYRVQLNVPQGNALFRVLDEVKFPAKWNFRSLLDAHKGVYRHNLTRLTVPGTPTLIRMNTHSRNYASVDCAEYVLYDRPLAAQELHLASKALLLYTPSNFAQDAIALLFKGFPDIRVLENDRLRSLNLSLLAFYMRTLKYIAHRRANAITEIQVVLVGGRTVEKSIEINGIYKIFGANIARPLHRVVTIRLKNETTPDGYPTYTIGGAAVSLADVKKALQSGYIGEIMDMVCITGPTLIDACVADLPTIFTLQEQTHLLEDPSRFIVLMSSEESWMSDLAVVRNLRGGSLQNMLVLVKARDSRQQCQTLFGDQNIVLFDRTDTSHARHFLRLFILSGIARHLTGILQHLHSTTK